MTYPRVLCLGEILFDLLADQLGRSLAEVESWTAYPGGAPANVACALVKLGVPTGFIGCVGQDEPGNSLVTLLEEIGVDGRGIQRHPTAPTREIYVLRSEGGDREFAGFGDKDTTEFADTFLEAKQLPVSLFEAAEFIILGTLELAYPQTRAAIYQALELAENYNLKVVVDVNWRPMFWHNVDEAKTLIYNLIKRVDFLKLSDEEAQWLFDTTDAGAINYRLNSVEGVLVTAGDGEVSYCLGENEGKLPIFPVDVQDTTGAGDSFVAGFIQQLCQKGISSLNDPEIAKSIVQYACAVGALTTLKPGAIAAQPTATEVEEFLTKRLGNE